MKININKYNDLELALMVLLNYFGTGDTRKRLLGTRYKKVQSLVNIIGTGVMPESSGGNIDLNKVREALNSLKPTDKDYSDYVDDIISYVRRYAQ